MTLLFSSFAQRMQIDFAIDLIGSVFQQEDNRSGHLIYSMSADAVAAVCCMAKLAQIMGAVQQRHFASNLLQSNPRLKTTQLKRLA